MMLPSPCVIWPGASPTRRPVKVILGVKEELEMLNPSPMLPAWSRAMEPIQRYDASGAYVPCWKMEGVPFATRTSYQRTPVDEPAVIEWFTTSASWSAKLRYARRNMSRSANESSFCEVPDCGMQVPPAHASL